MPVSEDLLMSSTFVSCLVKLTIIMQLLQRQIVQPEPSLDDHESHPSFMHYKLRIRIDLYDLASVGSLFERRSPRIGPPAGCFVQISHRWAASLSSRAITLDNMSSRDERVASFVSLTGADTTTAEGLLEV